MKIKNVVTSSELGDRKKDIVVWGSSYVTGIEVIDMQHRELVVLTNNLYHACLAGKEDVVGPVFKKTMDSLVKYVREHFSAEQVLLEKIGFPGYRDHKKLHDELIIQIVDAAKEYGQGRKFTPNHFVRTLKDWIFGHIAVNDKIYSAYVKEQVKKGHLKREDLC